MKDNFNILLTTDYQPWVNDPKYIKYIKREQLFIKHLIFKILFNYHNSPASIYRGTINATDATFNQRVLVYIHAGFGEREEKHYAFLVENSREYNRLIKTDDWVDKGELNEYIEFFYFNDLIE